jgi:hypothetical protein
MVPMTREIYELRERMVPDWLWKLGMNSPLIYCHVKLFIEGEFNWEELSRSLIEHLAAELDKSEEEQMKMMMREIPRMVIPITPAPPTPARS